LFDCLELGSELVQGHGLRREHLLVPVALPLDGVYVRNECYPILWRRINKDNDQTLGFVQSLGFHSLLGAMYLQMMWLLIEGDSARRCERPGCPRIVRFQPPQQPDAAAPRGTRGKYRTRKDKLYCSNACKQWVYDQTKKQRS
jgi:hypothetical protein